MATAVPPAPVPDGWYRHPDSGCIIPDTDADRAMHAHARAQRSAHHRRQPISADVQGTGDLNKLKARMEQELARFKAMNDAMAAARGESAVAVAPPVSEVSADQLEVLAENARLKAQLEALQAGGETKPSRSKKK